MVAIVHVPGRETKMAAVQPGVRPRSRDSRSGNAFWRTCSRLETVHETTMDEPRWGSFALANNAVMRA
jgi:hypothetical protein